MPRSCFFYPCFAASFLLSTVVMFYCSQSNTMDRLDSTSLKMSACDTLFQTPDLSDHVQSNGINATSFLPNISHLNSVNPISSSCDTPPTLCIGYARPEKPCVLCGIRHRLWNCPSFRQLSPSQRLDVVVQNSLCHNCFLSTHSTNRCGKKTSCFVKGCKARHSMWIHIDGCDYSDHSHRASHADPSSSTSQAYNISKKLEATYSESVKLLKPNSCIDACVAHIERMSNELNSKLHSLIAGFDQLQTKLNSLVEAMCCFIQSFNVTVCHDTLPVDTRFHQMESGVFYELSSLLPHPKKVHLCQLNCWIVDET